MNRDTGDTNSANNTTNITENQKQNQTPDIMDIQQIQSGQSNQNRETSQNNPGNSVMPLYQDNIKNQTPNQNRPVKNQPQRINPVVAPRRPSPQNLSQRPNNIQRQPGQNPERARTARDANMAERPDEFQEFQSGNTRTFDKNNNSSNSGNSRPRNNPGADPAKSASTGNSDGTYHFTGRDIRSSRQRFSDTSEKDNINNRNNKNRRKNQISEDDGSMQVSADKDKIRKHNKTAEAEAKKGGAIMSGVLKVVLYILGVFVISGILAYNIIMMANDVFAFVKDPLAVNISIPEDASIEKISQILYENNIIKYPKIFNFYINYRKKDKEWEFESGIYPVTADMNYDDLIATFRKKAAARVAVRITIPEGFTIDQIIDEFVVNNGIGSRDKFVEIINETDFSSFGYKFLKPLYDNKDNLSPDRKYILEGYLFPDTYDFYTDENELNIIMIFLNNFNAKFDEDFYKQCELINMSIDDVIILASIVEREAKFKDTFPGIAQVFHNRLNDKTRFPMLQSDATIMYSYGFVKADLTQDDLTEDLPYNTYTRNGLPPSAICNPGYEAIFAALWPEEPVRRVNSEDFDQHFEVEPDSPGFTKCIYFVTTIDGDVLFAKTSGQHEINRNRIRQERANAAAQQAQGD